MQLLMVATVYCSTCKQVTQLHPGITIGQDAIQSYVQQLDVAAVRAAGSRANVFPIKFDSLEAEVCLAGISF